MGIMLVATATSWAQTNPTTHAFSTAPPLSSSFGVPSWQNVATVVIGGVSYTLTAGGNGTFTHLTTSGSGNSACLRKDGSGGDQLEIRRTDNTPFTINSFWLKHESMFMPPFYQPPYYTITYNVVGGAAQTVLMNTQNSTDTYTPNLIVNSVMISFSSLLNFYIDDLTVSNAVFTEPTVQTSNITFTNLSGTGARINWTNGNGSNRLVVVKEVNSGSFTPADNTNYPASSSFTSANNPIGATGWRSMYRGTGSFVTLSGLTAGATYKVMIYEFNGSAGSENYNTTVAANTSSFTTIAPLPVSIAHLNVVREDGAALIKWATLMESNNKAFAIQWSADGSSWKTVGMVESKATGGNSQSRIDYQFSYQGIVTGTNYFRLEQQDFDGQSTISPVLRLNAGASITEPFTIAPNPVVDRLNIIVSADLKRCSVAVYDLSGKLVQHYDSDAANLGIDMRTYTAGLYLVRISSGSTVRTFRIQKL